MGAVRLGARLGTWAMGVTRPLCTPTAGCLIVLLTVTTLAGQRQDETLTGEQILDRTEKWYAACDTYRDSGTVRVVTAIAADAPSSPTGSVSDGARTTEFTFRTVFRRPDEFLFESSDTSGDPFGYYHYIVRRSGPRVQTWWSGRPGAGVDAPPLLLMGLSGARYIVGDPAVRIPALLFPDEFNGAAATAVVTMVPELVVRLTQPQRLPDAMLGGVGCFRVTGGRVIGRAGRMAGTDVLWIDKRTFLIRRIDFSWQGVEGSVTFNPEVDGSVTDAMLAFAPPVRR